MFMTHFVIIVFITFLVLTITLFIPCVVDLVVLYSMANVIIMIALIMVRVSFGVFFIIFTTVLLIVGVVIFMCHTD